MKIQEQEATQKKKRRNRKAKDNKQEQPFSTNAE